MDLLQYALMHITHHLVSKELEGTNVKTCIVVGFPLGATTKEVKAFEAKQAIENGAQEIDMVVNVGAIKSNKYDVVKDEIKAVVDACKWTSISKGNNRNLSFN